MATVPAVPTATTPAGINYHALACGKWIQLRAPVGCSEETGDEIRRLAERRLHVTTIKTNLEHDKSEHGQYCFEFKFDNQASSPNFNAFISDLMTADWERPIISDKPTFE